METERAVRKAVEHLALAKAHIENSEELSPMAKVVLAKKIQDLEEDLIIDWAKKVA